MKYALIATGRGKKAKVSLEDLPMVSPFKWHLSNGYASTRNGFIGAEVMMSKFIMWCPDGYVIDHINGDKHDNRRENLRIATMSENNTNRELKYKHKNKRKYSSQYRGVHWSKKDKKWIAQTRREKEDRPRILGYFDDEVSAAKAYDDMADKRWGKFARLNFPKNP